MRLLRIVEDCGVGLTKSNSWMEELITVLIVI